MQYLSTLKFCDLVSIKAQEGKQSIFKWGNRGEFGEGASYADLGWVSESVTAGGALDWQE